MICFVALDKALRELDAKVQKQILRQSLREGAKVTQAAVIARCPRSCAS